jgi:probable F420-dependent oxidoreductase
MRLGIITPVLTMLPRAHATWETDAPWDDVVRVAQAADRLGYHHLSCSEHVAVPVAAAAERGGRYYDPLATLGHLSAVTERIRLATYVLVLGYHHPLEIAKRYGTLDVVSGGRVVLGVGVGSLEEEFDLLGAPFTDRGERADDAMRALRAAWGRREPVYRGSHHSFDGLVVDPHATRPEVAMWVGGRTARSLRRALALGDGWAPFGLTRDEVASMLAAEQDAARVGGFEVVLQPGRPLDPTGEPDESEAALQRWQAAGATVVSLRFVHHSPAHYVEQLEAAMALSPSERSS